MERTKLGKDSQAAGGIARLGRIPDVLRALAIVALEHLHLNDYGRNRALHCLKSLIAIFSSHETHVGYDAASTFAKATNEFGKMLRFGEGRIVVDCPLLEVVEDSPTLSG